MHFFSYRGENALRLSAEIKILLLALFGVAAISSTRLFELIILASILAVSIAILNASTRKLFRIFLPALPMIIAIALIQTLFMGLEKGQFSNEVTVTALISGIRMALLFIAGSLVTITTTETEFSNAIEGIIKPISPRLGKDIATMMMLSIAFLPIIAREFESIRMAQEARGVSFKGPAGWLKGVSSMIIPAMFAVSGRADRIAQAMESRCYGYDIKKDR
jgi:energy-coupling factor transporter transmembrane protein EcfT